MSHESEPIICPNCGHEANLNYCAQCGQETHLHKDTLAGLFMHFVGHFFHYDSKFWKTLRALLFNPGKLTTAYKDKQRMRYIAPISLYLFVSAIFFITLSEVTKATHSKAFEKDFFAHDSVQSNIKAGDISIMLKDDSKGNVKTDLEKNSPVRKMEDIFILLERALFFMIPIMAIVLQLLFVRNRGYSFVDHTIFSLHFQSFFFCVLLMFVIDPFQYINNSVTDFIDNFFSFALAITPFIYVVGALKNYYKISTRKSILFSLLIGISYFVIFLFVAIGYYLCLYSLNEYTHHGK